MKIVPVFAIVFIVSCAIGSALALVIDSFAHLHGVECKLAPSVIALLKSFL